MDDYIFLIIAVVISIFAAIKKSKKKEEIPLPGEVKRPRNFLLDQLLGEDFLAESNEEFEDPMSIQPVLKKEPLVVAPEIRTSKLMRKGSSLSLPKRTSRGIQLSVKPKNLSGFELETEEEESDGSYEGFSLRKAVIYSEILNPKY